MKNPTRYALRTINSRFEELPTGIAEIASLYAHIVVSTDTKTL